jgi:serine/threonine-protein kinase
MSARDLVGTVLGGTYRLERLIGEGGMGAVFAASHSRLPRKFAVKMLKAEILEQGDLFDRFRREAEIASALGHRNIVQVMDFNTAEDGAPYMVLELLEGEDLCRRLTRLGRLDLEQAVSIGTQVAGALEVAHHASIVHRDLKPANVFLIRENGRDDVVKILDFGISKVLHDSSLATRSGHVFGTPNYMSPEQAEGRQSALDARTDIFALGTILYECLSGRRAFDAPTVPGTIFQVCYAAPPPLRSFATELSAEVENVINRAIAKRREDRYARVGDLRDDLLRLVGKVPEAATEIGMVPPTVASAPTIAATTMGGTAAEVTAAPSVARRSRAPWIAAGGATALAAIAAVVLATRSDSPRPAAPVATHAPAPAVQPTVPPPRPAPPPEAKTAEIRLRLSPADARVELDGVPTLDNPIRLPHADRMARLTIRAPGHVPQTRDVNASVNSDIEVTLARERSASPPRPTARQRRRAPGPVSDDL